MAIKIIKKGNTKEVFEGLCGECVCEFEYDREDITVTYYDQREKYNYHRIKCPYCSRDLWIIERRKRY